MSKSNIVYINICDDAQVEYALVSSDETSNKMIGVNTIAHDIGKARSNTMYIDLITFLDNHSLQIGDINVCVLVVGSSSFSTVRIGVAVVNCLVYSLGTKALIVNQDDFIDYLRSVQYVMDNADSQYISPLYTHTPDYMQ